MRRAGIVAVGLVLAGHAISQSFAQAQAPDAKPTIGTWGFDLAGMDRTVKPGDDFFRYANGAWFDNAVIPPTAPARAHFSNLEIQSEDRVRAILADLEARPESLSPEEKKVADLYRSYIDAQRIEELGLKPTEKDLNAIAAAKTHDDVARLMASVPLQLPRTVSCWHRLRRQESRCLCGLHPPIGPRPARPRLLSDRRERNGRGARRLPALYRRHSELGRHCRCRCQGGRDLRRSKPRSPKSTGRAPTGAMPTRPTIR